MDHVVQETLSNTHVFKSTGDNTLDSLFTLPVDWVLKTGVRFESPLSETEQLKPFHWVNSLKKTVPTARKASHSS